MLRRNRSNSPSKAASAVRRYENGVNGLAIFLTFVVREDLKPLPVAGQPLEEVVALHVAVVVGPRDIGRVQVDEVEVPRVHAEDVAGAGHVAPAVVEDAGVVGRDLLLEVLLDRQPEVAPPVLVPRGVPGHGEDAARLALRARPDQRREREGPPVGIARRAQVRPDLVQETEVGGREEDPAEGPSMKWSCRGRARREADGPLRPGPPSCSRPWPRDRRWEAQEVVGHDPLPHRLQEVGDTTRAAEAVEGGVERMPDRIPFSQGSSRCLLPMRRSGG